MKNTTNSLKENVLEYLKKINAKPQKPMHSRQIVWGTLGSGSSIPTPQEELELVEVKVKKVFKTRKTCYGSKYLLIHIVAYCIFRSSFKTHPFFQPLIHFS